MKNVFHILLLFLLAQAATFAQSDTTAYVQALADSIIVDNTIKETIRLDCRLPYFVTFLANRIANH